MNSTEGDQLQISYGYHDSRILAFRLILLASDQLSSFYTSNEGNSVFTYKLLGIPLKFVYYPLTVVAFLLLGIVILTFSLS